MGCAVVYADTEVDLMAATLWSPEAFAAQSATTALIWGIYFGMLIIALLFMMAMVAINRNRPYLILTVALVINSLHAANSQGFFTKMLWSTHPAWGNISIGVTGSWALAATIWTIREFLVRRYELIRLDYLYIAAAWFCAICPLSQAFALYGEAMRVALGLNLSGVIGGLLILASRRKQFEKLEWIITFVLIFYLSGFMATYLQVLGYIPASSRLLFCRDSLLIFIPLFACATLLLEVRRTYWDLLQEKSRALELSIQSERSAETLLRTLYDTTSEAVMLVNEQGFMGCNKATLKLFGCATEEAFCKFHPADLSPPEQPGGMDSRVLADQRIAKALAEGSIRFEWLHKRADNGALFYAYVILNAMELNGKRVLQALTQDITERKKLEETIHNLAYYDALTELPNRRMLDDRLAQAFAGSQRTGAYGALMFLDLDNFKPLNDKYGHAVGDLLLTEAAQRLNGCVRGIDTVARLGGDEFVVMLNGLNHDQDVSRAEAIKVAEKIHNILAAPYYLHVEKYTQPENIVEYHCSASIGGVLFKGYELSQEEILNRSDQAMYQAKAEGRNLIRFA